MHYDYYGGFVVRFVSLLSGKVIIIKCFDWAFVVFLVSANNDDRSVLTAACVNLWSNNKKLMTNNEGLVNYGADLLRLSKLSP
jgi:hypothetical protein